jgi:S-adenosylmethionine:diacylglycerol 3-amino-3-carboxypropyl transferase
MANPWQRGRLTIGRRPQVMFGRMYEDPAAELSVFPTGGRVLAIASAGDTAAALARAGHQVTAVDISATQLAYAKARLAGAPAATGTAERLQALARRAAGAVVPGWRPAAITTFLQLDDLAAQREHWRRHLDRPGLAALMRLAFASAGLVRRDLWRSLPPRMDLVLRQRLATGLTSHPNATNPWAWRLLLGRECPAAAETGSPGTPVDGIDWVHGDVAAHLRSVPSGWYDAATLSNVLDGPPAAFADELRDALRHGVRAGGPVVLRTFGATSPLPGDPLPDRSLLWGAVVRLRPLTAAPAGRAAGAPAGRAVGAAAGRAGPLTAGP